MAHAHVPIDITKAPELQQLAETVRQSGQPHALKRGAKTVAVVRPASKQQPGPRVPRRRSGVLKADDALFRLIGIGASGGSGDVSANKHSYLADAYAAKAE